MTPIATSALAHAGPILLYNDECSVCRRIAGWVKKSAMGKSGESSIVVQPIGDDPKVLKALNPGLDIWEAYATIHTLMPDGTMKLGGESVAEVFRNLPNTKWFAWSFSVSIFGFRPFQMVLNLGYTILADIRPLFGCESCGIPGWWSRPISSLFRRTNVQLRTGRSAPVRSTILAKPLKGPSADAPTTQQ